LPQNNFPKILLAAIEEGLSSLGDSPRDAIFYHLESSFQLKKEDIPSNLTEFKQALERIFGPGAPYLEKAITKSLYAKLGLDFEDERTNDFIDSAHHAEKRIKPAGEVNIK
jgi:hypothetical protein